MSDASDLRRDAVVAVAPDSTITPGRGFIYAIICKPTQKRYIGQTLNFRRRIWTHRSNLRNQKHWCAELQDDWNKHGPDAFIFVITQEVPKDEMNVIEARFILEATVNYGGCYNYLISVDPKTGSLTPTSKLRQRHSEALKKAWADPTTHLKRPIRTRWDDPEQRRIQSESQKRRYSDPEERRKTAEATKLGHTPEVRKRKSESSKLVWAKRKKN